MGVATGGQKSTNSIHSWLRFECFEGRARARGVKSHYNASNVLSWRREGEGEFSVFIPNNAWGAGEEMVVRFETERMLVWEMFVACHTYVLWSRSDFLVRAHSILVMSVG